MHSVDDLVVFLCGFNLLVGRHIYKFDDVHGW